MVKMPKRVGKDGLPIFGFACLANWEQWLSTQPKEAKGLWLELAKKTSGIASVSRQEAIDGALCHGWIDGQLQKSDELHWLIRFTPRSAKSKWSKINKTKAQELIDLGRMTTGGLEQVERAREDGRWESAYEPQSTAVVPADLKAALAKSRKAKAMFSKLDSRNRYAILHRIHGVKRAETRALKIEKYVAMLEREETIYPQKLKQ
jgi:uncharacterized protein YdeI (YjbR/CyaY-like superfamily)